MSVRIIQGDCREVLRTLADDSVHSIVTDPPYHLTTGKKGGTRTTGFNGMQWDGGDVAFQPETWREAMRVLRPGGFLLAFGGTRTYHRLACAIEDAGFEIRDMVSWLYGRGFPKGTDKAKIPSEWKGWNTALKPACEPICMARKPMQGTLAENLTKWGTGAINVDGCRIGDDGGCAGAGAGAGGRVYGDGLNGAFARPVPGLGRWPANVIHDGSDEVVALFPESAGQQCDVRGTEPSHTGMEGTNCYGEFGRVPAVARNDTGSVARFFYCAKASRKDVNVGCDDLDEKPLLWSSGEQSPGTFQAPGTNRSARNNHPTVKPTELMRYLVKLVTPPGGTVLDPFAGSGSTGRACDIEQFDAILIELDPEYAAIARRRINGDSPLFAAATEDAA